MSLETEPVIFPEHFGFCEGVKAADDLLGDVSRIAREYGIETVYGLHGIVHNDDVIQQHEANGVRFVDDISEIPEDSLVVTSAHGVGPEVVFELEQKGMTAFDAACPLVIHTHKAAQRARREREKVIYVCHGKPGEVEKLHDEVLGMLGHLNYAFQDGMLVEDAIERHYLELGEEPDPKILSEDGRYRVITQTTLHADNTLAYREEVAAYIRALQPDAKVGLSQLGEVCRAVAERQQGVAQLIELRPRRLVVATDSSSKNGMGYVALARELAPDTMTVHAVANAEEAATLEVIEGITALTASASTPDSTTFAVALELGLKKIPDITRESFKLTDARPGVVAQKIAEHVHRIQGKVV